MNVSLYVEQKQMRNSKIHIPKARYILAGVAAVSLMAVSCSFPSKNIPFVEARNYFVSNQVHEVPSSIDNRTDFEHYFGTAAYMGKDGPPTAIDFNRQYVIAVAPPAGRQATVLKAKELKKENGQIIFTYRQQTDSISRIFSSRPLLLIVVDKEHDGQVVLRAEADKP